MFIFNRLQTIHWTRYRVLKTLTVVNQNTILWYKSDLLSPHEWVTVYHSVSKFKKVLQRKKLKELGYCTDRQALTELSSSCFITNYETVRVNCGLFQIRVYRATNLTFKTFCFLQPLVLHPRIEKCQINSSVRLGSSLDSFSLVAAFPLSNTLPFPSPRVFYDIPYLHRESKLYYYTSSRYSFPLLSYFSRQYDTIKFCIKLQIWDWMFCFSSLSN